jgi:purine-nucleoside/S-methyl-5'-thioadenosine phosphorylase / adenosine deaminase
MDWREDNGVPVLEARLPGAVALFTTRVGGVSEGPFDSLNLGLLTGDEADRVHENRGRVAAAAGTTTDRIVIGRQVHGTEVLAQGRPARPSPFADGVAAPPSDGQIATGDEAVPLVMVADCLPVAVSGPGGVAMLHCGWRGLAGGIIDRGARAVDARAAAVGPGIGPCCYEVGTEVLAAFSGLGAGIAGGRMLDLRAVATRLLEATGIDATEVSELCTSCNRELFFSHRRDRGRTGRQAGLVRALSEAAS